VLLRLLHFVLNIAHSNTSETLLIMLFIPQEVKDKIAALEAENQSLKEQVGTLQSTKPAVKVVEKKPAFSPWILAIPLVAAIGFIIFLLFFKTPSQSNAPTPDPEAVAIIDGKIEKWNPANRDGIVYRVQIGSYENFSLDKYKQNLEGLKQDSIDGMKRVSLGAFSRLADAQQFQAEVVRMGLENAYVVAYENGQPIALFEAIRKEN
jgi:hypothetical protein